MKLKILPQKCVLYLCAKLTSWGRQENFTHRTSLWDVYKTSLRRFPKKRRLNDVTLRTPFWDVLRASAEHFSKTLRISNI